MRSCRERGQSSTHPSGLGVGSKIQEASRSRRASSPERDASLSRCRQAAARGSSIAVMAARAADVFSEQQHMKLSTAILRYLTELRPLLLAETKVSSCDASLPGKSAKADALLLPVHT